MTEVLPDDAPCLAWALASTLDVPVSELPSLRAESGLAQLEIVAEWAAERGLRLVEVPLVEGWHEWDDFTPYNAERALGLACGHAVGLDRHGRIAADVNPKGETDRSSIEVAVVFIPADA